MKLLWSLPLIAVVLVGCQSYPMGLSEAQWNALSPEQQADYTRQQTQINEHNAAVNARPPSRRVRRRRPRGPERSGHASNSLTPAPVTVMWSR